VQKLGIERKQKILFILDFLDNSNNKVSTLQMVGIHVLTTGIVAAWIEYEVIIGA
jgi:hypothetical protein